MTRVLFVTAITLFASAVSAQSAEDPNERIEHGERLFARGDIDGALAEWERAYELAGDHPGRFAILYNIGQAHERRFRYDLAMRYYRRYLEEGGADVEGRAQVEARIDSLEGLLATIRVEVNVPHADVWAGDRRIGEAPGDVLIPGGIHVLELRAPGYAAERRQVQVAPRTETTERFTMRRYAPETGLEPAWFWVTASAAAVVALAGGSVGIVALVRRGEIDAQLEDPVLARMLGEPERAELRAMAAAADGLYGAAFALAATAFVLALFTRFDPRPNVRARGASLSVSW